MRIICMKDDFIRRRSVVMVFWLVRNVLNIWIVATKTGIVASGKKGK